MEGLGRDDSVFCQFLASRGIDSACMLDLATISCDDMKQLASAWIGYIMFCSTPAPKGGHADQYMNTIEANLPDGILDNPLLLEWLSGRHETNDFPFTLLENLKEDVVRFRYFVEHREKEITACKHIMKEAMHHELWPAFVDHLEELGVERTCMASFDDLCEGDIEEYSNDWHKFLDQHKNDAKA